MPAKKKSEENSDNKAPTSTTKKIPPLNSHFSPKNANKNSIKCPIAPNKQKKQKYP